MFKEPSGPQCLLYKLIWQDSGAGFPVTAGRFPPAVFPPHYLNLTFQFPADATAKC